MLLIRCHLHAGKKDQARAEFETVLELSPGRSEQLRRWFAEMTR
jgi:hypothetical protein